MRCPKCGSNNVVCQVSETKKATITYAVCQNCGYTEQTDYKKKKSNSGWWGLLVIVIVIIIIATSYGKEQKTNSGLGQTNVRSDTQKAESKEEYIAKCKEIDFETLSRNPDKYKGEHFVFTGEVIQVIEPSYGNTVTLRINVTKSKYGNYSDTIMATVEIPKEADRILEDDIITIYGECEGITNYKSIFGQKISVPKISIKYFTIENDKNTSKK